MGPRRTKPVMQRLDASLARLAAGLLLAGLLIGVFTLLALSVRELPTDRREAAATLPWQGRDREERQLSEDPSRQAGALRCPPCPAGLGRALPPPPSPQYCWLGLPYDSGPAAVDPGAAGTSGGDAGAAAGKAGAPGKHKLAVLIPYRDREDHLVALLEALVPYLQRQHRAFDVFVLEQGDGYLFNRGALLNAGALLLQGSAYDHFVFQDVDTIPVERETGGVQYRYPRGAAPLHLTPFGLHPKANYEDFFGGILVMTARQMWEVNGFADHFWGWGREDDNLRERLIGAGLWPPQHPDVPKKTKGYYFKHQGHKQAAELRAQQADNGSVTYFEELPALPYRGAHIVSSQPRWLADTASGLNTTRFKVLGVRPVVGGAATRFTLSLYCNETATPWCDPGVISERPAGGKPRFHSSAHAVASNI